MRNPSVIPHVTKETPSNEIAEVMSQLASRYVGLLCNKCNKHKSVAIKKERTCEHCELPWYEARTAMLRIVRNLFELPPNRDVPKGIMQICSHHTEDAMNGNITPAFIASIDKLKKFDEKKGWKNYLPAEVACTECGMLFSKRKNQTHDLCIMCVITKKFVKTKENENESAI